MMSNRDDSALLLSSSPAAPSFEHGIAQPTRANEARASHTSTAAREMAEHAQPHGVTAGLSQKRRLSLVRLIRLRQIVVCTKGTF